MYKKFMADTTIANSKDIIQKFESIGFNYQTEYVSKPRQGYTANKVGIFSREININVVKSQRKTDTKHYQKSKEFLLNELTGATEKISVANPPLANAENKGFLDGGDAPYGRPIYAPAPISPCCELSFSDIVSIQRMKNDNNSLVLALDTEFYSVCDGGSRQRKILCWQFAFIEPSKPNFIQELIFVSTDGRRLHFSFVLSWICTHYDVSVLAPDGFTAHEYRSTRRYVYHTLAPANNGRVITHRTDDLFVAIDKSGFPNEKDVLRKSIYRPHKAKPNAINDMNIAYYDLGTIVDGYINDFSESNKCALPITLLCHAGKADITAFCLSGADDFIPRLSDVQGGLVSLNNYYSHAPLSNEYWKFYPFSISVRDTMCFAPAGKKSLASLGDTIGVPKLDVSADDKNDMLGYLNREPCNFAEYAINDSVITLLYASELWGYNKTMPVTVSGASVRAAVPVIADYLGITDFELNSKSNREEFNRLFRGLHTVKKGLSEMPDKAAFIENTALEPLNDRCRIIQDYARLAYHGGYNGSVVIGKFDGVLTHDYDLENAYPTCMSCVPDLDWKNVVIASEIVRRNLLLQDFHSPFDLMFCYIKFRFPDSVVFPCIPVNVDGCMVFPRSSDGLDGVYASAPELYLALRLGAEIYVEHGYVGAFLYTADGNLSFSLRSAVMQLVSDRNMAQEYFGKKSLPDLLLKTAVNSLYGKTAQDLVDKSTWNAFKERMENIGGSAITSPTHATLTTAGVRAVLLATMNELVSLGYTVYSVTTDGFISDAPFDVLDSLNLFGFSFYFRQARVYLTGSSDMWSEKHCQDDLLNFTTRGNVSLSEHGVCAHNSFDTGFEKDSYDDRLSLMTTVLGRTDKCLCCHKSFAQFRPLSARENRSDFFVANKNRLISMDFDMKRKPIKSSFTTVYPVVNDVQYEIANFCTEPYSTVSEYKTYKVKAQNSKVLRTEKDWAVFFAKLERSDNGGYRQITDLSWSILFTCVMGYRLGLWKIPHLDDKSLTVKDKIDWINKFNQSSKKFTENTWKDCRKSTRQSQMLDRILIEDTLNAMQNWSE